MKRAMLLAMLGLALLVVGTTLAVSPPRGPRGVKDYRSGQQELCEVAKLAASDALDHLDFEGYRNWQDRIRASCLAAATP